MATFTTSTKAAKVRDALNTFAHVAGNDGKLETVDAANRVLRMLYKDDDTAAKLYDILHSQLG